MMASERSSRSTSTFAMNSSQLLRMPWSTTSYSSRSKTLMAWKRRRRPGIVAGSSVSICLRQSSTSWSKVMGTGSWLLRAASTAFFARCSTPSPRSADISTTGTLSLRASSSVLIFIPRFLTTSIWLSATTIGTPNSMSCVVRYRLRSRLDASTMLTMASGLPLERKFRATISSLEYGESE